MKQIPDDKPMMGEFLEHHHDEELIKLSKDLNDYAIKRLRELRKAYVTIPLELEASERLYKDIISSTSVFLSETNHWFKNE